MPESTNIMCIQYIKLYIEPQNQELYKLTSADFDVQAINIWLSNYTI